MPRDKSALESWTHFTIAWQNIPVDESNNLGLDVRIAETLNILNIFQAIPHYTLKEKLLPSLVARLLRVMHL